TGAGMFTVNRVQAAPVAVSREHLELAQPQAIVANSGVANAETGRAGVDAARVSAKAAAAKLGIAQEEVLVLSTGVIGQPLPVDRVLSGITRIVMREDGGPAAAEAIMTTDTHAKESVAHGPG